MYARRRLPRILFMLFLCLSVTARLEAAASTGTITGRVLDSTGRPAAEVIVTLEPTNRTARTNADGTFRFADVAAGTYRLRADAKGTTAVRTVSLDAEGTATVELTLGEAPRLLPGIVVWAARTAERSDVLRALSPIAIRRSPARVTGELIRELPGADSVRRGPVGLDPVIRGLRETEVGVYLDGTRLFPGGPARMDSALSHLDPTVIREIEVEKGPYALTWGAGNQSAIRVETHGVPENARPLQGILTGGYQTNGSVSHAAAALFGRRDGLRYRLDSAWRRGDDYTTGGEGTTVPAGFRSREVRGRIEYDLAEGSSIDLRLGHQRQDDIDYPGRLLNARYFDVLNLSGRWRLERTEGSLRSLELLAYRNTVDHEMDNEGKPTAEPMEGRMPPFALNVVVASSIAVTGGRAAATLVPSDATRLEVGGDLYVARRDALRSIRRRDNGKLLFEDAMWPDATIADAGLFVEGTRFVGSRVKASAALRLDVVRASAEGVSEFFRANAPGELETTEVNPSGSLLFAVELSPDLALEAGIGSVVRTADATERYSDRIPASKAQMSAEFLGNPELKPERSTQADLALRGTISGVSLSIDGFVRRIDDYITLEPTDLPKRLPLSPPTVFRYVNGTARFFGAEAAIGMALSERLHWRLGAAYLWGEDVTLDEPALGVSPPTLDLSVRYGGSDRPYLLEGVLRIAGAQDRVAATRGELPTEGYATADFRGEIDLGRGVRLRGGILNVTDADYVNHLNAKNPFSGEPIPEIGRVFFVETSVAF